MADTNAAVDKAIATGDKTAAAKKAAADAHAAMQGVQAPTGANVISPWAMVPPAPPDTSKTNWGKAGTRNEGAHPEK